MHYFALLISREQDRTPDEGAAEMAAYEAFHAKAASAIRAGDALAPAATGVRITGGPDAPTITDGPFAEGAEVAGGYYVFEAENLDEALALGPRHPGGQARRGRGVADGPLVESVPRSRSTAATGWHCCWNRPTTRVHARQPEWEAGIGRARRVRRRGGRSHQRRRGASSTGHGDDRAGARRRRPAHRRALRRGRGGRERHLPARRRRPRRGRQDRVDDPGDDRRGAATHGDLWAVAAE